MSRSPFPVPFGWYQVGYPSDVAPGETLPLFYFGAHLVLWRDEKGVAHLNAAHCPHLGAHLGHGGRAAGTEIVCPFHGWRFDGDGNNTEIPYSDRINRSCNLRPYPLIERNGVLLAWYHPEGEDPQWEIPEVPELSDPDHYSEPVHREFFVESPWQEMAENAVDSAHFRFVHAQEIVPTIDTFETDGPIARVRSTQRWPTPDGVVDAVVEADNYGPGLSVLRMNGIIDSVSLGCNTPVTADRCHLRFSFSVRKYDDETVTELVGGTFIKVLTQQVGEDARIWEHKSFMPRPALAPEDGPFMKFRSWAAQFYVDEVDLGCGPYQPARPPDQQPARSVVP